MEFMLFLISPTILFFPPYNSKNNYLCFAVKATEDQNKEYNVHKVRYLASE